MQSSRSSMVGICVLLLAGGVAWSRPVAEIEVSSPSFRAGEPMPARFSYKGQNLSPELHISNVPANARSLLLIVDDPDSPSGLWTHWLVWNIPANTTKIAEGAAPSGAMEGKNSFGHNRYDGPVPPSGTHRYFFRVYALDAPLTLSPDAGHDAVTQALANHVVGTGEFFGTYSATP